MSCRAVDPARLLRALNLEVEPLAPGVYRVIRGREPHTVRIGPRGPWECDCADSAWRPGTRCKHIIGVYLYRQLAAPVRTALQAAVGLS